MSESSININNILASSAIKNGAFVFSIIPLFIGYYLQDIIFTRSIAEVTTNIPDFIDNLTINKLFLLLLPYIIALLLFYISGIICANSIPKITLDTIHTLMDQILQSIKTSKKSINVNELILHIKMISETKTIYRIVITYIVPTLIISVALIYTFLCNDVKSGIIVIFIIIMLLLITIKLEYSSINNAQKAEECANDLYDELHEILTNVDTVITSNTQNKELDNMNLAKGKTIKCNYITEIGNVNTTYSLQAISIIAILSINYYSYKLYSNKLINSSTLITNVLLSLLFMDYYNYCIHAIVELTMNIGKLKEAQNYFATFKIIDDKFNNNNDNNNNNIINDNDLHINKGDIKIENLLVKYDNNIIFNRINLEIHGGKIIGLIGPIGSGKSTILKCLLKIMNYEGSIYIDNQNLRDCSYESIAKNIAYIPQYPKLFNKTIIYNIGYGTNLTDDDIINKIKDLRLLTFFNSFSDGLNTIVGKEGMKLSGGQKQFVALIRSLVQNKMIILMDEPTSSLDQKNKFILMDLIKNIKNKTIIITTHDQQLIPLFDHVIDMINVKNIKI